MSSSLTAFTGADIFDGARMHAGHALLVDGATVSGIVPVAGIPAGAAVATVNGGTIAPGYVDLQVNGGGGVMLNDDQSVAALATIAEAHASLGATSILPTLITDTRDRTRAAIDAVEQAVAEAVPGIAGLHLEGPHLSLSRKGAHDPALIRPMEEADQAMLKDAASRLPVLKTTIAPENVNLEQMRDLSAAGIILSLGHTDAGYAECAAAVGAGVSCATHLFNAMSQLGNREPGLVGAALALGGLSAGLIADRIHVHTASIATALRAKREPGRIFLVTDAMATAGSPIEEFVLNGRTIRRQDKRLTLEDGTLAGADLDLTTAVRNLVEHVGTSFETALAMATSIPAQVIGRGNAMGRLAKGLSADFIHLDERIHLAGVWRSGKELVRRR